MVRRYFTVSQAQYRCAHCAEERPRDPARRFDNCLISKDGRHLYRLTFLPAPPSPLAAMLRAFSFKTNRLPLNKEDDHAT